LKLLKKFLKGILAFVFAYLAMAGTAELFDRMNWPVLHSWAMGHGMFLFVIPFYFFLFYKMLGKLAWFRTDRQNER